MVDAIKNGWRDSSGGLSKLTVEKRILPALNEKLGCQRSYAQYQSRLKWFKNRFNNFSELMRHSSGFGWDPITKRFTASDEVWEDYLKRLLEAIAMLIHVLKEVIIDNNGERIEHPLARRPITSHGYNYIQNVLTEDSDNFRQNSRYCHTRETFYRSHFATRLHNFLRKECRSDEFPIELDSDESPSPLPMNDVDNFEQLFETQEQQREHANEWRAKIALDMWRDTQQGETNANQR
nr:putative nuclease HARBI1 [Ipomoea batatas]